MLEGADKVIHGIRKKSDFTAIQKGNILDIASFNLNVGKAASDVFTEADVHI